MHRRRLQSRLATLIVLILLTACHGTDPHQTQDKTGNILYVDAANPDGLSWATAFPDLQSAVDIARTAGGGEVWVAADPTAATDPVLTMKEGVALYAGFAGTETARNQRDWRVNVTVIDGEDMRRCVVGAKHVVLDGFAITRGYACGLRWRDG